MFSGIRNTVASVFGRAPNKQETETPEAGSGMTTASGIKMDFDDGDTAVPVDEGGDAAETPDAGGGMTTASGIKMDFDDGDTATPVDEGGDAAETPDAGGGMTTASGIRMDFDDGDAASPVDDGDEAVGGFGTGRAPARADTIPEVRSDVDAFGSGEIIPPAQESEAVAVREIAPNEVDASRLDPSPFEASPFDTLAAAEVAASGDVHATRVDESDSTEDPDAGGDIA